MILKSKKILFPSISLTHQPTLTDQVCLLLRDRAQEAKEADHSKYETMMIVMTMIMAKEAIIQKVCTPRIAAIVRVLIALEPKRSYTELQSFCSLSSIVLLTLSPPNVSPTNSTCIRQSPHSTTTNRELSRFIIHQSYREVLIGPILVSNI